MKGSKERLLFRLFVVAFHLTRIKTTDGIHQTNVDDIDASTVCFKLFINRIVKEVYLYRECPAHFHGQSLHFHMGIRDIYRRFLCRLRLVYT